MIHCNNINSYCLTCERLCFPYWVIIRFRIAYIVMFIMCQLCISLNSNRVHRHTVSWTREEEKIGSNAIMKMKMMNWRGFIEDKYSQNNIFFMICLFQFTKVNEIYLVERIFSQMKVSANRKTMQIYVDLS